MQSPFTAELIGKRRGNTRDQPSVLHAHVLTRDTLAGGEEKLNQSAAALSLFNRGLWVGK